jgi:hypothetical protein
VAAIASTNEIVVASDLMVTLLGGTFSADMSLLKGREIVNARWAIAFAGEEIGRVSPIVSRVRDELRDKAEEGALSVEAVAESVMRHYQRERTALAVEKYLSLYGLDMAEFLANGLNIFGEQGFALLRERMEQVKLDCSLLIHGFDDQDRPHLVVVEDPGIPQFMGIGYWAIGSGAYLALSRLSAHAQSLMVPLNETVYNVFEAKIAAERAIGVGQITNAFILESGQKELRLSAGTAARVIKEATSQLEKSPPKKLLEAIATDVDRAKRTRGEKRKIRPVAPQVRAVPTRGRKRRLPSQG